MSAKSHLLRVEGINHDAVLNDTDDISTRRGASAMLRDAPAELAQHFTELKLELSEASLAVFQVNTKEADELVSRILADLAQRYPHITFVADAAPLQNGFADTLAEVTARNRFRQFRQPTVAVPTLPDESPQSYTCEIDRLRPPATELRRGDTTLNVSASVHDRHEHGRVQRESFLRQTLGSTDNLATTSNLKDLAADPTGRFANLGDKMAVIYADGNSFGGIKRSLQNDSRLIREFDNRVQNLHKAYLRELVTAARNDTDFQTEGSLRLEVLLFGGDELMLVTPAWKGMAALQLFFEVVVAEKDDPSLSQAVRDKALSYAAGLVFCSANTPISEIVRSTKQLAEQVKSVERSANRFDYLVLESVDYPTRSIAQFRASHFGAAAAERLKPLAPLTEGGHMQGLEHLPWGKRIGETASFLDSCPRGGTRSLAQAWLDWQNAVNSDEKQHLHEDFLQRAKRFEDINGKIVQELYSRLFTHLVPQHADFSDHDHPGWVHLTELWDYLAPLPGATRGVGQ